MTIRNGIHLTPTKYDEWGLPIPCQYQETRSREEKYRALMDGAADWSDRASESCPGAARICNGVADRLRSEASDLLTREEVIPGL